MISTTIISRTIHHTVFIEYQYGIFIPKTPTFVTRVLFLYFKQINKKIQNDNKYKVLNSLLVQKWLNYTQVQ